MRFLVTNTRDRQRRPRALCKPKEEGGERGQTGEGNAEPAGQPEEYSFGRKQETFINIILILIFSHIDAFHHRGEGSGGVAGPRELARCPPRPAALRHRHLLKL